MKKVTAIALLVCLCILKTGAQCLNSEQEYKNYYEKNISSLDPIEGIWSNSYTLKQYDKGETQTKYYPNFQTVYIIKSNGIFRMCGLNITSPDVISKTELTKTSIDGVYLFSKEGRSTVTGTTFSIKANAILKDEKLLEYTYENDYGAKKINDWNSVRYTNQYGIDVTTDADREEYIRNEQVIIDLKCIKIFPTESAIKKSQSGSGTAFALTSNGLIITNYHVVNGASKISVRGINGNFSKVYHATVVSVDKNNDLAIIKIDDPLFYGLGNIPYTIANKTSEVGSSVFVLGYPLRASMGDEIKLTNGIISSKSGFQGDITSYQISVPIQPGNSGGAMYDSKGTIVGIVNAKLVGAENASYAIKTPYLINLLESLPSVPQLQLVNLLNGKSMTEQVKIIKKFTYIVEVE